MQFSAKVEPAGWLLAEAPVIAPSSFSALLHKIGNLAFGLLSIRLISVAGLVVALWVCPVQIFTDLGFYLAAVNLAALGVFGRYELLVIAADDERKCADAFHLCILTSTFTLTGIFAVAITMQHLFATSVALYLVGALFARAWLRLGLTLATRHGRYDLAVKALLPHAIGQPVILAYLIYKGHSPFLAFVMSDLLGQLIAAACVCWSEGKAFSTLLLWPLRFRKVSALASLNVGLPTLNFTAAASAFLFATAPLFFLPVMTNDFQTGTLALLFRVLDVPTALASSSLSIVLLKEVADRNRHGMLRGTFLMPAAIAVVVFGSISLAGLALSTLELEPSWHMALTILPVVALFQAGIAATAPLIDIATLAGRQKGLFTLNVAAMAFAGSALLLWRNDPSFAILVAGSVGFVRMLVMSVWLARAGGLAPAE
jgi:hypothetical protein